MSSSEQFPEAKSERKKRLKKTGKRILAGVALTAVAGGAAGEIAHVYRGHQASVAHAKKLEQKEFAKDQTTVKKIVEPMLEQAVKMQIVKEGGKAKLAQAVNEMPQGSTGLTVDVPANSYDYLSGGEQWSTYKGKKENDSTYIEVVYGAYESGPNKGKANIDNPIAADFTYSQSTGNIVQDYEMRTPSAGGEWYAKEASDSDSGSFIASTEGNFDMNKADARQQIVEDWHDTSDN